MTERRGVIVNKEKSEEVPRRVDGKGRYRTEGPSRESGRMKRILKKSPVVYVRVSN